IRGQWVESKPEQLQGALKYWERRQGANNLNRQDVLRLALSLDTTKADTGVPLTRVAADGWIGELLKSLEQNAHVQPLPTPSTFRGELRPYQNAGLAWLVFLRQWSLGGCLADDMGLGKTIQVAALLLHQQGQTKPDTSQTLV